MSTPRRLLASLIAAWLLQASAGAEVEPVAIRFAEQEVWAGQQASFYVDLRAPGSFVGAASFTLPDLPRTVIVKLGNPVVSSEEIEDESYFVQTHHFALFSQQSGRLTIPEFEVRFSHREGFTGPGIEVESKVPEAAIEVRRLPSLPESTFVITTDRFEVTQSWSPEPGRAEQGAVFKRTIRQKASNMSGMALFPPPAGEIDGVRLYPGSPQVSDRIDRGDLRGERTDTLSYLFQRPGAVTIPAIKYVWWNPESSEFQSTTLPEQTFEIAASPSIADEGPSPQRATRWYGWLAAGLLAIAAGLYNRSFLLSRGRRLWRRLRPPDRVAAKELLRACRQNDVDRALAAWTAWESTRSGTPQASQELASAIVELYRSRYGVEPTPWNGERLANAFRKHLKDQGSPINSAPRRRLPRLNPTSGLPAAGERKTLPVAGP